MRKIIILLLLCIAALTNASAQSPASGIVINEIYIGTIRTLLANDSYIELYNPTDRTLYLDGCVLARCDTSGGKLSGDKITGIAEAWVFPGTRGIHTLKVLPGQFIVIAVNATKTNGGLDLSNADYETYTGLPLVETDNPAAKNLRKLQAGAFVLDLNLSQVHDAILIADGSDTVMTDGLDVSSILDGVQYAKSGNPNLPGNIDLGMTGGVGLKLGVSMERTEVGVSTKNSSVDFSLRNKPTPGYQFGSEPGSLPKVIDLFPLSLGVRNEYNAYATDSNGVIIPAQKTKALTVIWRDNYNFGGSSGVLWQKDTSAILGSSQMIESNLYYRANEAGDLLAYGNQEFISQFVPPFYALVVTPPDSFVNYFVLSAGFRKPYPIMNLTQKIDLFGTPADVNFTSRGQFIGIDTVTVPAGKFDSAFVFVLSGEIQASVSGIPILNESGTKRVWIVKGYGIVKTNQPTRNSNGIPITGEERQLVKQSIQSINRVFSTASDNMLVVYPQPIHQVMKIKCHYTDNHNLIKGKIELFSIDGKFITELYRGALSEEIECIRPVNISAGTYFLSIGDEVFSYLTKVVIE